jgi:hypothetical protein
MQPSLAVIILNYKRPQNIGIIARSARQALPDAAIFVLDQAETDSLRGRTDVDWSEVWFQRARVNRGAGARVPLSAGLPFDYYLAIDDDNFLTPRQIARLVDLFRAEPDRAHGIRGQRLILNQGVIGHNLVARLDGVVSILNCVYAFSRAQAAAALGLSVRLGFASWHEIGFSDDIVLSCGSHKPPLCHDLGEIAECPTSHQPGIAVWKREGFVQRRNEIIRRLIDLQAIALFEATTSPPTGKHV